ncbi:MAG: redoxin family protein [Acidobacteriaceae bacterium]|nr:redoxin family protein [Acidobacteriaceae bacterium]
MWRFVALFLLSLVGLFADEVHPILPLGAPAPDFSLRGVDGKTHKLSDYSSSNILVIVFTCNHCPTAQLYEGRIQRLADDYRGKGVVLVAIDPNNPAAIRLDELGYTDVSDSFDDMKIRAAYRHFDFPYLYDGDTQSVARAYGPQATPHVFIFDRERKLRYQGRIDNSQRESLVKTQDARNAIDALLAGQLVAVTHTGVFGCSTKWISKEESAASEMKKMEAEPVAVDLVSADDLQKLKKNPTGKVLLINFWATWCGGCVHELPDLETTWRMYRLRDYDFVTVAANMPDEKPGVLKYLQRLHGSSRNVLFGSTDTDQMQHSFNPAWEGALPYSVLLSPDGKVLYEHQGEVDILKLRRIILGNLPDPDYLGHRAYWAKSVSRP